MNVKGRVRPDRRGYRDVCELTRDRHPATVDPARKPKTRRFVVVLSSGVHIAVELIGHVHELGTQSEPSS